MSSVYEAAGCTEGLLRLAEAWHTRVMADEVVSHAFSHGFHPQHNQRLAAYWAEALGGPHGYTERYGNETAVVRIHSGNGPHEEMDQRAIACFDHALEDVGLAEEHFGRCYTTTSPGRPRRPCRLTTSQPTTPARLEHPSLVVERPGTLVASFDHWQISPFYFATGTHDLARISM